MQMGLQENPHTSWWLSNDVESSDDHEYRHASPYEREPMFEKPLTPSDVGKLNRLVIPKQHAEKHFPLSGDAAGTLLGFEDEVGKCWRFRYSYWNSSQSYVLTKGWSRYVKEKRLDAGDVIFFERHRAEPRRVFIGWRRRGSAPLQPMGYFQVHDTWGQIHAAPAARVVAEVATQVEEATAGSSNNRRLVRLFGVNLECEHENPSSSSQTTSSSSEISFMSGQQQLQQPPYGYYFDYNTRHPHHSYHMEMNFLQGVNQMGNGLG